MNHQKYMQRALDLAKKGMGKASPNPMVGCVIVKNNRIIGEGYHRRYGADHAEVAALKTVKGSAKDAVMYVTLEPCFHQGKTPPCVEAVIESEIKEIHVAMKDPNPLTNGKSIQRLRRAGIAVCIGECREEAEELNRGFICRIKNKKPFVVAKIAQTLDGKIATSTGHSKWITSEKARRFSRSKRQEFDAIVVGIETVLADDPLLDSSKKSHKIKKVIVDSRLRLSKNAQLLKKTDSKQIIIATTNKAKAKDIQYFQNLGADVLICRQKKSRVDLKDLVKKLLKFGINNLLIEGGSTLIGSALKDKIVDRIHLFIAPKIVGDKDAKSSVVGFELKKINQALELKQKNIQQIGNDLFLEFEV